MDGWDGGSRGLGEFEVIQDHIPEWLAVLIALLTQLGDVWFLGLVLGLLYWSMTAYRDGIATVAGIWLAGMGLYKGLKDLFGFPRPEEPLLDAELLPWIIQSVYETTAMASGYGFPSGHAVNTTIVYFGLAHVLPIGTRRSRYAGAAGIVLLVGFTRIALGVHFVVDIVVGIAVGLCLLGAAGMLMTRQLSDRTTIAFGLAIPFGGFFVLASSFDWDAIVILGASLGAFGSWQLVMLGRQIVLYTRPSRALRPILIRGSLATGAFLPIFVSFELFPLLSAYTAGGAAGILTGVIVIVPILGHAPRARRVGVGIWFWLLIVASGLRQLLRLRTWKRGMRTIRRYIERRKR